MSPRVVFGVPVFNKAAYLEDAIGSLLAQSFRDLAVVLIDDRSDDETVAVARRLAARDDRLEVHVNDRRLGMLDNTRRALDFARLRFPEAEFWALGSDHDLWEPAWAERLVALLDTHPDAVMACPMSDRIDAHGEPYPRAKPPLRFDTLEVAGPRERMRAAFEGMSAGSMIYGLFRASALDELGHYRAVLVPDRLLLSELALRGSFAQEPALLWRRRFRGLAELDRQRLAFWPGGVPWHAKLPWWLQHAGALALAYVVRGEGRGVGIGRVAGVRLALEYLKLALALRFRRRLARARRFGRRNGPRRQLRRALGRLGPRMGPLLRRGIAALCRRPLTRPLAERVLAPRFERVVAAIDRRAPVGNRARTP